MLTIENMLLILLILGLTCLLLSTRSSGGLGYRGMSTLILGMKVWKFSNKIFGLALLASSFFLFLFSIYSSFSEARFRGLVLIFVFLSMVLTDLITLRKYRKKM